MHRNVWELLILGGVLFLFYSALIAFFRVIGSQGPPRFLREFAKVAGTAIAVCGPLAIVTTSWTTIAMWMAKAAKVSVTPIIVGLLTFVVGLIAVLFKDHDRSMYGMVEIIFGTVGAGFASTRIVSQETFLGAMVAIVACIYVVVRGFENLAWDRKPPVRKRLTLRKLFQQIPDFLHKSVNATITLKSRMPMKGRLKKKVESFLFQFHLATLNLWQMELFGFRFQTEDA